MIQISTDTIKALKGHSNLDAFYGPYFITESDTKSNPDSEKYKEFATFSELETDLNRYTKIGLTVGIIDEDGKISEYWFLKDNENLLKLSEKGLNLKLNNITLEVVNPEPEDPDTTIRLHYTSKVSSIFGTNALKLYYRKDNGLWVLYTLRDFLKNGETIIIKNLETGEYDFRIVLSDIFRESVEYTLNDVIIGQYTLEYDIKLALTLPVIRTINNLESNHVKISYKIRILPNSPVSEGDFHFFLDTTQLDTLIQTDNLWHEVDLNDAFFNGVSSGGWLYIGTPSNKKKLFNILGSNTLDVEVNKAQKEFFWNDPTSVVFDFETGASVMFITTSEDSDFTLRDGIVQLDNFNESTGKQTERIWIVPKEVEKDTSKIIFKFSTVREDLDSTSNPPVPVSLGKISELVDVDRDSAWPDTEVNNVSSFYLDFSATLHKTSNDSDKLLEINNDIYIDNNIIQIEGLRTVTPVEQGDVYIGIGYHLQDSNPNISETSLYNCICINGVVVAVKKLEEADYTSVTNLNIKTDNNIVFKKKSTTTCKGLLYEAEGNISLVRGNNNILCELNYNFDFDIVEKTLPTLTLTAKHFVPGTTYYTWKGNPLEATFGTLSDGATKCQTKSAFDLSKKLLQMGTDAKSSCLKKYAVLCHYDYNDGDGHSKDGDVLVYTQGTSTLNYPLPNFKLFFLNDSTFDILVEDKTFSERVVTLKADYMESSHLNNTPTAILFNKAVLKLAEENESGSIVFNASPPVNIMLNDPESSVNYSDAIVGTPIVLRILDINGDLANYGSFMLNTDKVSDSLGFNCYGENFRCMSFEGTTNFAEGSAARFFYDENASKISAENHGSETGEQTIHINSLLLSTAYIENPDWDDDTKFEGLWLDNKDGIAKYLARGFEFRYPESTDFLDEETETTITSKAEPYLKEFFKMWRQISLLNDQIIDETTQLPRDKTDEEKKEIISNLFDVDYCKLYIIFLIVFAQSDNLGKNCMFDCWEIPEGNGKKWGKWYPRPYDLDSINGLTNGGVEDVPPFAFVSPDWISDVTTQYNRLVSHNYKQYNSIIYRYSSENSILWSNIYKLYRADIQTMYLKLRNSIFNTNTLIEYYYNAIIDKISISLYNIDFLNKYVASPEMEFMYGNRWTSFKDWITARLSFCDSFFRCNEVYLLGRGSSGYSFNIEYMFPAFYTRLRENGEESNKYFGTRITDSAPDGAVRYTIYLADDLVKSNDIFSYNIFNTTFGALKNWNFISQKSIEINSEIYPKINEMALLEDLTIGETASLENYDLIVPNSVKTLIIKSQIKSLTFNEGSNLQECILENINISNDLQLDFIHCENLSLLTLKNVTTPKLTLENSNLNLVIEGNSIIDSLTITGGSYESLILKNQTFSNINITGTPTIKLLDLYNSTVSNRILDLSNVFYDNNSQFTLNIIRSNILKVKVSNDFKKIKNLKLGVLESSLIGFSTEEVNNNNTYIDLDLFAEVSGKTRKCIAYTNENVTSAEPINKVSDVYIDENGVYKDKQVGSTTISTNIEHDGICFGLTPVETVKISKGKTINGCCLFAKCNSLATIEIKTSELTDDAIFSSNFVFYDCCVLNVLPEKLKLSKFKGAFIGTSVNWATAFGAIYDADVYMLTINNLNVSVVDFSYFYCFVTPSTTTFTVDFSSILYAKPTIITGMFFNTYDSGKFIYKDARYQTITTNSNGTTSISYAKQRPVSYYNIIVNNLFNESQGNLDYLFTGYNSLIDLTSPDDDQNWNADSGKRTHITLNLGTFNNNIGGTSTSIFNKVTSASRTFLGCNVLFNDITKNPVHFINKIIANEKITTIKGIFADSRFKWSNIIDKDFLINIDDPNSTNYHHICSLASSNTLIDLDNVFYNAYFGKIKTGYETWFYIDGFFENLSGNDGTRTLNGSGTVSNKNLNIECCFGRCANALIKDNLLIHSNIKVVYMGGFMSLGSRSTIIEKIPIFWNSKFKIRNYIAVSTGTYASSNSNYFAFVYPFLNRRVKITNISENNKLSLHGDNILCYCGYIYTGDNSAISIHISDTSNFDRICMGASDVLVQINDLRPNCTGVEAFSGCTFYSNINFSTSSFTNLINTSKMFYDSNLSVIEFTIPDVTTATEMFRLCKHLKGGLPNNFFGNILIATRMFYMTLITRKTPDTSSRDNIVLPGSILNAVGMFARTKLKGSSPESFSVTVNCASNSDITGIFASSYIPLNSSDGEKIIFDTLGNTITADYALVNVNKSSTIWNKIKGKLSLAKGLWAHSTAYDETSFDPIPDGIQIKDGMFANWENGSISPSFIIPSEYRDDYSDWSDIN